MSRKYCKAGFLSLMLLMPFAVHGDGFQFEEGTHYTLLEVPIRSRNAAVVEVTEYFSYGCPHCYRFEPMVQNWKNTLPQEVDFNRTPAIWSVPGYELYARTFYTAQALGILEKVHYPIFQAIHSDRRSLVDLKSMAEFVAEKGVDPEEFIKTFSDSFGVKAQYQQAIARQRIYKSNGVPAIIVNGKYRIEASMVGNSNSAMLQVADFLIEKELQLIKAGPNT
jgi:thiol:disulfide interchange protein DsbA